MKFVFNYYWLSFQVSTKSESRLWLKGKERKGKGGQFERERQKEDKILSRARSGCCRGKLDHSLARRSLDELLKGKFVRMELRGRFPIKCFSRQTQEGEQQQQAQRNSSHLGRRLWEERRIIRN